ncbi:GDSL-type esterase/lipase family protein [Virgibacillus sp. LDC-1]|uniref:GDSL-type esterase/lipase family protein n=1 Tax=Virgibacillus sp. LDC-1 TaxID=3039856 RepID=UPI0024DEDFCF|nr:GDSL-type esterase/lipase family protein [Virgibacillus sp. LDC-1]
MQANNNHAEVYLLGFYNPFERYFQEIKELSMIVNEWNKTSKKVTEQYNHTTYIPTKDLFNSKEKTLFAADHFHPNQQGYQRMAQRVLEYITNREER